MGENEKLDKEVLKFLDIVANKTDNGYVWREACTFIKEFERVKGLSMELPTTKPIIDAAVKKVSKDIIKPKCVRDGLVTPTKEGKYVIIDLRNMDFMKNEKGEINYYDTLDAASSTCGMYEFENAWVCKLIYNHIE